MCELEMEFSDASDTLDLVDYVGGELENRKIIRPFVTHTQHS